MATGLNFVGEGRRITLAALADDIIMIGETEEGVIRTAEKLMSKREKIGLQVNDQKTKYSIISRRELVRDSLVVGDLFFEGMSNFKYL